MGDAFDIYHLVSTIDLYSEESCATGDTNLSNKLSKLEQLDTIYYYPCYGAIHNKLPKTRDKINELICNSLECEDSRRWHTYRCFDSWLNEESKLKICKVWLSGNDDEEYQAPSRALWMSKMSDSFDDDIKLDILRKMVNIYKNRRIGKMSREIGRLFSCLRQDKVEEGCDIISGSTPSVVVNLLKRSDISDKYMIKGMKSLSKLSSQKSLDIKIDFNILKKLGPKARLDAMKQLLGMFNSFYKYDKKYGGKYFYSYSMRKRKREYEEIKDKMPFKVMPTKEEIEQFLFPCSIKYNTEVVDLINRFEELTSNQ